MMEVTNEETLVSPLGLDLSPRIMAGIVTHGLNHSLLCQRIYCSGSSLPLGERHAIRYFSVCRSGFYVVELDRVKNKRAWKGLEHGRVIMGTKDKRIALVRKNLPKR